MSNTIEQRVNPCSHPFTVMENEVLKCSVCGSVLTPTIEQRAEAKYPSKVKYVGEMQINARRREGYIAGATEERALNRAILIKAANRGQDFASANADTVHYDTIEDMIDAEFVGDIEEHSSIGAEKYKTLQQVWEETCIDKIGHVEPLSELHKMAWLKYTSHQTASLEERVKELEEVLTEALQIMETRYKIEPSVFISAGFKLSIDKVKKSLNYDKKKNNETDKI